MRELSLHVMDIVQNSLSAGASLTEISVTEQGKQMAIAIIDNGRGMSQEQVKSVIDPFFYDPHHPQGRPWRTLV